MTLWRSAQKFVFAELNGVVEPLAKSAFTGPLQIGSGLVSLETTGRRSGAIRSRPVVAARVGSLVMAGTIRSSSDWMANLRATPRAAMWVMGERRSAVAAVTRLPVGSVALFRLD